MIKAQKAMKNMVQMSENTRQLGQLKIWSNHLRRYGTSDPNDAFWKLCAVYLRLVGAVAT